MLEMCPDVPVGPVAVAVARARQAALMLEDRRRASERSIPPGSPVALLASLGYLSADGDGVDEPELEQNNSRLQALLNRSEYDTRTHESGSLQFCTWTVII